jgi:hypothetical protein
MATGVFLAASTLPSPDRWKSQKRHRVFKQTKSVRLVASRRFGWGHVEQHQLTALSCHMVITFCHRMTRATMVPGKKIS